MFEIFFALCLGICLSAATGLRVFAPFLVISVASKFGVIGTADSYQWISTWPALFLFGTATIVEISAYYIPWLDNLLDTIATPAAGIAGTLIAVVVFPGDFATLAKWALAIIAGGGTATAVQAVTVGARATSSVASGGLTNFVISTTENIGSFLISIVSIFIPIILGCIILLILVPILLYILYKFYRSLKPKYGTV